MLFKMETLVQVLRLVSLDGGSDDSFVNGLWEKTPLTERRSMLSLTRNKSRETSSTTGNDYCVDRVLIVDNMERLLETISRTYSTDDAIVVSDDEMLRIEIRRPPTAVDLPRLELRTRAKTCQLIFHGDDCGCLRRLIDSLRRSGVRRLLISGQSCMDFRSLNFGDLDVQVDAKTVWFAPDGVRTLGLGLDTDLKGNLNTDDYGIKPYNLVRLRVEHVKDFEKIQDRLPLLKSLVIGVSDNTKKFVISSSSVEYCRIDRLHRGINLIFPQLREVEVGYAWNKGGLRLSHCPLLTSVIARHWFPGRVAYVLADLTVGFSIDPPPATQTVGRTGLTSFPTIIHKREVTT